MKIGKPAEIQQSELVRATQAAGTGKAGSAGGPVEATSAAASVQLSDTSRRLAAQAGSTGETIRAEKVEEVRRAISEGRFDVNAAVVAEKMIAEAAELLETLSQPR